MHSSSYIRTVSLSVFVFVLGWGLGGDVFFSYYINLITENLLLVSLIGAFFAMIRLFFVIPIGELDDKSDMKRIMIVGKLLYFVAGIMYFLAGIYSSVLILLLAIILNAIGGSCVYTTYKTYLRKYSNKSQECRVFGVFFFSLYGALTIGSFLSAILIRYIDLPYMFLFVSLSAILSILLDKNFPSLSIKKIKTIFAKESFTHQFFRTIFSIKLFKKVFIHFTKYSNKLHLAFMIQVLRSVINYVGFLFIPLLVINEGFSLSKVAIIYGIMSLPYITNIIVGNFGDRYNKNIFIVVFFAFLSILLITLSVVNNFVGILIITFLISLFLSFLNPIISGLISGLSDKNHNGTITGIQEFSYRIGEVFGAIMFGVFAYLFDMKYAFMSISILIFIIILFYSYKIFYKNRIVC